MNALAQCLANVEAVAEEIGLPALAERSNVPYTTLAVWRRHGWRSRSVRGLERVVEAAEAHLNPDVAG